MILGEKNSIFFVAMPFLTDEWSREVVTLVRRETVNMSLKRSYVGVREQVLAHVGCVHDLEVAFWTHLLLYIGKPFGVEQ